MQFLLSLSSRAIIILINITLARSCFRLIRRWGGAFLHLLLVADYQPIEIAIQPLQCIIIIKRAGGNTLDRIYNTKEPRRTRNTLLSGTNRPTDPPVDGESSRHILFYLIAINVSARGKHIAHHHRLTSRVDNESRDVSTRPARLFIIKRRGAARYKITVSICSTNTTFLYSAERGDKPPHNFNCGYSLSLDSPRHGL